MQYPRKSTGSYEWLKKVGERENSNAQKMAYNGGFLRLIPTEDIILHKSLRINTFKENHNINSERPSSMDLKALQNSINSLKKDYTINQFNIAPKDVHRAISRIRLYADIFDIKALSTYKGMDKKYFLEGMEDYKKLKHKKKGLLNWLYSINPNVFNGE